MSLLINLNVSLMSLMSHFQESERWKSNAILNTRLTNFKEANYKSDFHLKL